LSVFQKNRQGKKIKKNKAFKGFLARYGDKPVSSVFLSH